MRRSNAFLSVNLRFHGRCLQTGLVTDRIDIPEDDKSTTSALQPVIGERVIDVSRESAIIVQWPWQRIRRLNRAPCPGPTKSKFEAPWRHIKVEQLANGRREWMKNPDSDSTGERESGKLGIKFTRTDYFSGAAGVVRPSSSSICNTDDSPLPVKAQEITQTSSSAHPVG